VRCWRRLAENAAASLVKGDPVVVTGRLFTRNYEHEGQRRTALTIEASSVAADLSWCTAVLKRDRRGPEKVEAATGRAMEAHDVDDASAALVGALPGGEG
jgi:single-strand DNA-binding protein